MQPADGNNGHRGELNECPLYPRKRTLNSLGMLAASAASSRVSECLRFGRWTAVLLLVGSGVRLTVIREIVPLPALR